jgi:hypothetical protein
MLQLKPGEALLNHDHPVCRDWDPELNKGVRRIFAAGPAAKAYTQVFGRNMPPASAQFLDSLGTSKPDQSSLLLYHIDELIFFRQQISTFRH